MTYESDAEAYRRKLSEIIATPEFKLTGPMAIQLVLALTSIHSALDERELYVRRQSSRGSRGGSNYEPVSLRRQIGQLKEAIDGLTENLHDAANPSFDLDD